MPPPFANITGPSFIFQPREEAPTAVTLRGRGNPRLDKMTISAASDAVLYRHCVLSAIPRKLVAGLPREGCAYAYDGHARLAEAPKDGAIIIP